MTHFDLNLVMRPLLSSVVLSFVLTGVALAGGSPKAFEKFVGSYEGEGTFKDQILNQTVTAEIESDGSLAMASSPRSAVLSMSGMVETSDGREFPMSWKLTFRRKNACVVEIVYPSGAVAQVNGRYDASKRRISFSGPMRYIKNGALRSGTTTGSLRLAFGRITFYQQDTLSLPSEVVTVRQTLTKK